MQATREDVLGYRVRVQQLDGGPGHGADVLDLGVQDTGPDGARWALALRGLPDDDLVLLWTVRGAPHLYRRADLGSVVPAVSPFSDADAAQRVHDASKPWRAVGLPGLAALDEVAAAVRDVVDVPRPKGAVSAALTQRLPAHFLRDCVPCGATHVWEQPFRLAAVRAGLELQRGTAPPVLERVPGFAPAAVPEPRHDVVRGYLHLLGPAAPRHVAGFLDAALADVRARWPSDAVEVTVGGEPRWLLPEDVDLLGPPPPGVLLLGPYDLYLQSVKDRELLVADPARRKALFPVIGRPGAVVSAGEVVGTWRPRAAGRRLRVLVDLWADVDADALRQAAERLAAFRGTVLEDLQHA